MSTTLLFVKLGGSILTDKTRAERLDSATLESTVQIIAETLREQPALRLLIGHGGGSFGHYWAERYGTHRGVTDAAGWEGAARVADAQGRLNRVIVGALLEAGVAAIGVPPSASARTRSGTVHEMETATLERMLYGVRGDSGAAEGGRCLVPVVHGDVVLDEIQQVAICSTEAIFQYLAPRLRPQRIVLVGEAGVFTADPRRDPGAVRIAQINAANIEAVLAQTGASHGTDVTGGMAAKVLHMWQLVQAVPGLVVQLVGTEPTALRQALRGEPVASGTIISR